MGVPVELISPLLSYAATAPSMVIATLQLELPVTDIVTESLVPDFKSQLSLLYIHTLLASDAVFVEEVGVVYVIAPVTTAPGAGVHLQSYATSFPVGAGCDSFLLQDEKSVITIVKNKSVLIFNKFFLS